MTGYHVKEIKRGVFGELSKIREEFEELEDANAQGARIMILCELSDMYGAIEAYVRKHYNMDMEDLRTMSDLTNQAFEDGTRKARVPEPD